MLLLCSSLRVFSLRQSGSCSGRRQAGAKHHKNQFPFLGTLKIRGLQNDKHEGTIMHGKTDRGVGMTKAFELQSGLGSFALLPNFVTSCAAISAAALASWLSYGTWA